MKKFFQMDYRKTALLLVICFSFILGCKKDKCEDTIDQAYVYPVEKAIGKSYEERIKIFKIPETILHCLSTEALAKSCLDYPGIGFVWAYNGLQKGFDQLNTNCNGFDELWERGDKFHALYSLYQQKNVDRGDWDSHTDLENGLYLFDIVYVELVISQYEVLQNLSLSEKTKLFQLVLDNQKKKVDLIKYYGPVGMQTSIAILGRIMYLDNYEPLVQEYNSNEMVFLSVSELLMRNYNVVNTIMSLSEDYLKNLKSKQK
jgi:hypothetical protein